MLCGKVEEHGEWRRFIRRARVLRGVTGDGAVTSIGANANPDEGVMKESTNKMAFTRFADAVNTGDTALISKTIDEFVEPNALIRTPLPIEATGPALLKEVFGRLHRAFPTFTLRSRI
jgi:hypothetical protein